MSLLQTLLTKRHLPGHPRGIPSVCSAHPWVIRASIQQALADGSPLLIEATSNQVNQQGGYTGMQPADFRALVTGIAQEESFPTDRLLFGGDHLGPNPWQRLPADEAMTLAEAMVAQYAAAGFTKLHLDASMPCAGDPSHLSDSTVAERAARLCAAAERAADPCHPPVYIIGTEVPVPGGATESLGELAVTPRAAAQTTLDIHQQIFAEHGLGPVWPRVIGLVIQPGVEFNHDTVVHYDPVKARDLITLLDSAPNTLVFEAHSTDYQLPEAYQQLVRDGFSILKVGPALTFAMREALFALAAIESKLVDEPLRSHLPEVVEEAMLRDPGNWQNHYHGTPAEQYLLRRFSYSDRVRYFWGAPAVARATRQLLANLHPLAIPETLVSAYLPEQYRRFRERNQLFAPEPLILDRIRQALEPYAAACFPSA